jgi:hypothetical protein
MNPTTYIYRKTVPWLLIWAAVIVALLASCTKETPPEVRPDFQEWEWAKCLPSAAGYDCEGDKPSWEHYQATGQILWRYEVSGRTIYKDEWGHVWRIYQTVHCLNADGERVGTHYNMGFRSFQYAYDPITGELPNADDWGVLEGVLCIFGAIGPDGQVGPVIW